MSVSFTAAARNVDADLFQNVWNNRLARLHTVFRENFGHFEHLQHPVKTLRDTAYHPKVRC